jgi:thiol-disulfide isomerase/thioredoxin
MIKEITGKDIRSKSDGFYVKSGGGLLLVKADWCGHCQRAMPELEEVSRLTGEMFPVYKLDADKNKSAVTMLGVKGFPTIFFIEADGKISTPYNKERKTKVIIDEICSVMKKCFK